MRQQWVLGGHVLVMVLGLDLLLAAPAFASSGACEQIKMACRSAGFIEGGGRAGDGLEADCFAPIVRGTPQPNRASRPLPQVDPRLAGACRAAIPGTDVQPAQSAAQRDGGGSVVRSPIPVEGGAPNGLVAVLVNKPGQSFDSGNVQQSLHSRRCAANSLERHRAG
jgi:hypothetical protein